MRKKSLINIAQRLSQSVAGLSFSEPVSYVYNPLEYAWESHRRYLELYGCKTGRTLLLGMNPGPWGMAQTGIPFGEVHAVQHFLGINEPINKPQLEHEKRPVLGLMCPRSEVSGRRLWEWAADRFGSASSFFEQFFVWNYCPLCFMEEGGKNRTPDKLKPNERDELFSVCDESLQAVVDTITPTRIIGIGGFATKRAIQALGRKEIGTILHPSPASPAANRGWAPQIEKQLIEMGIQLPVSAMNT